MKEKKKYLNIKYDKEEKSILKAFESGKLKLSSPAKNKIESIRNSADNTFKKSI